MRFRTVRYPMTYEEVIDVMNMNDVILPDDYCRWIGPVNGAAADGVIVNAPGLGEISYERNVPLNSESSLSAFRLREYMPEKSLFPFGSVGNGDYFCINMDTGSIVLYMHEQMKTIKVCDTFREFMQITDE